MVISINGSTIGEEEIRTGFSGDSGLDPGDGFGNGSKLESSDARGSQERREDHVVARGHANDVVDCSVEPLHEAAPGPAGAQHHHPGLLMGLSGPQARMTSRSGRGTEPGQGSEAARACDGGGGELGGEVSQPGHSGRTCET